MRQKQEGRGGGGEGVRGEGLAKETTGSKDVKNRAADCGVCHSRNCSVCHSRNLYPPQGLS